MISSALHGRVLRGALSLLLPVLAQGLSGCGTSADEPPEPLGTVASAVLCVNGQACSATQGSCTGTGTCVSGSCVVSHWCNDNLNCTTDSCQLIRGVYSCVNASNCSGSNQCKTCSAITGTCSVNKTNGTSCNDGNACTTPDTCQTGVCTGGPAPNCNDSNACTTDACNTSTGCTHTNMTNGTSCNDGNACTTPDTCQTGVCTGGPAPNCNDSNACTTDACNTSTGCTHTNVTNGTSCNDGNACTTPDTCQTGVCTGGPAPNCNDSNACTTDACNTSTGCTHTNVTNGTSCNDGNACTTPDTCQTGVCTGGPAPNCNDSNACTTDACNTSTGCTHTNMTNGTSCNDGNACTTPDTCQTGVCTGGPAPNCNDSNACTTDACNTSTGCTHTNVTNGASCNDGNACTTSDTCQTGVCTGGPAPNCNDSNACTTDACNTSTGCTHTNVTNGTSCNDGNACTTPDACQTGVCTGGPAPDCNDTNACTTDACNTSTGCTHANVTNGTACDDGNGCSAASSCQAGTCVGTGWTSCPGDQCNDAGTCDPGTGACIRPPKPAGTSCADWNQCNLNDQCDGNGNCSGSGTRVCNDGDPCTIDYCYPYEGCKTSPAPPETACDDNDFCTTVDHCQDGACVGTSPTTCTPLDQCHVAGTCDPGTGVCSNPQKPDGTLCDNDANLCTQGDACQAGVCTAGPAVTCTGANQCKTCNSSTGICDVNKANGTGCDDSNGCTQTDTCVEGTCLGTNPVVCTASNNCHEVGTCSPASGQCSDPQKANGTACNHGDPCWVGESCQAGQCTGGGAFNCTNPAQCQNATTCTVRDGGPFCDYPAKADGTQCDDDDGCTQTDTCQGGLCDGSNAVVCTAKDECHVAGTCNPSTGLCPDPAKPNGSWCTDNDECTQSDSCQAGVCLGNDPIVCYPDGNPCTSDACNPVAGSCDYSAEPAAHGCDDGNFCTGSDHCDGLGACVGGPGNTGLACDDQNACTGPDACTAQGWCAGADVNKDDSNACTDDICDPMSGVWHVPLAWGTPCGDGNPLDGDELCNANQTCIEGTMGKTVLLPDPAVIERRLGTGRHPVAVSPQWMAVALVEVLDDAAPRIRVATFSHLGERKGAGTITPVLLDAGPVIAGLPSGGFVVAYTEPGDPDAGGDGSEVALRTVSAEGVVGDQKVYANKDKLFGQRAPDIIWAGDRLVVGWEDESIAGVRQVCWREFSDKLAPLSEPECDDDKVTASSLTLAASGTEYARAWRREGAGGPSVEVKLPGGRRSFALADASSAGAPALVGVGTEWLVVYTEGCGIQKAAILTDATDLVGEYDAQAAPPERYDPSLAVTRVGVYLSWREPAQFVNGEWEPKLDELYLDKLVLGSKITLSGPKFTLPAGSALLQGDQTNAALVPVELGDTDAVLAAWEDWNPNVTGHCKHGDVLISLIVTPVVMP